MCICTPSNRTPRCPNCPINVIKAKSPTETAFEQRECNLLDFYTAASENLSHATFLHLVKKAKEKAGAYPT